MGTSRRSPPAIDEALDKAALVIPGQARSFLI